MNLLLNNKDAYKHQKAFYYLEIQLIFGIFEKLRGGNRSKAAFSDQPLGSRLWSFRCASTAGQRGYLQKTDRAFSREYPLWRVYQILYLRVGSSHLFGKW